MNKQAILQSSVYPIVCSMVNCIGLKTKKSNGGGILYLRIPCSGSAK